jgi:hypothetical protein
MRAVLHRNYDRHPLQLTVLESDRNDGSPIAFGLIHDRSLLGMAQETSFARGRERSKGDGLGVPFRTLNFCGKTDEDGKRAGGEFAGNRDQVKTIQKGRDCQG